MNLYVCISIRRPSGGLSGTAEKLNEEEVAVQKESLNQNEAFGGEEVHKKEATEEEGKEEEENEEESKEEENEKREA